MRLQAWQLVSEEDFQVFVLDSFNSGAISGIFSLHLAVKYRDKHD